MKSWLSCVERGSDMSTLMQRVGEIGLVPVIKLESARKAVGLGRALVAGGIPVAEVTFRTAAAEEAIRAMAAELPELLVGAGTVLTVDQAERALAAGAKFIVSPCYVDEVVAYCQERGIPVLPGVVNPDGVAKGLAQGLDVLKFFPAGPAGGTAMLDAMAGPFGSARFVPTGGIDASNVSSYARRTNVHAIGGTWMVRPDLVEAEDWQAVEGLCREAVFALHDFSFAHLGISGQDEAECRAVAGRFQQLFNFAPTEGGASIFAGDRVEITRTPCPGAKGHLAIRCNQVERAVAYLKRAGIQARPETAKGAPGRLKAIYLDLELAGFAVHLLGR
jgi:2-dehydro-3-deoxyphosphogluconate aldolase/(4S)-4-hydroxy-2-oxoglutarate aldolase